jgi:hypothetical protein
MIVLNPNAALPDDRPLVMKAIAIVIGAALIMLLIKMSSLIVIPSDPGPFKSCDPGLTQIFTAQVLSPSTLPVCISTEIHSRS